MPAIHGVQRDELVAARNLATLQETLIETTRQLLMTLTRLPQMQRRDREGCDAILAGVLAQCPYYAVLAAADPEGRVFASAPEAKGPVNIADRLFFQQAIQTRAFFVGEPVLGRISNKYSINLSFPILDNAWPAARGAHRRPGFDLVGKPVGQERFSGYHRHGFIRFHRESALPVSRTPEIHRQNVAGFPDQDWGHRR